MDDNIDWDKLIKKTKGYSGADVANVCREAAMMPLRKQLAEGKLSITEIANIKPEEIEAPISMDDLVQSMKNIQKSVSNDLLKQYADWMAEFGST